MKIRRFNEDIQNNKIIAPTLTAEHGWVNVKIDEKIFYRLRRYIPALDRLLDKSGRRYRFNMLKKIQKLSQIEKHLNGNNVSLQDKISIIVILQYLKEIKNNFNASTAGFLLEGFLATLIYGKLTEERSAADLISKEYDELDPVEFKANGLDGNTRGKSYQIKFYRETKNGIIKVSWEKDRRCDYYVICLKKPSGDIDVCILDGKKKQKADNTINTDTGYIGDYTQANKVINSNITDDEEKWFVKTDKNNNKKYINIKTNIIESKYKIPLKISKIDELVEQCGKSIQLGLKDVFDSLSAVHYNIDTLITGYDVTGKNKVSVDVASDKCILDIKTLQTKVDNLSKELKPPNDSQLNLFD